MKKSLIFYLIFLFLNFANADVIKISKNNTYQEILSKSEIFIDRSKKLSINDISKMSHKFQKNKKSTLSFGYSPNFNVWIKFSLENKTNKPITKILEYANPLTTNLEFFDLKDKKVYKDGLFQINKQRKSVNPYFELTLKPNETKTYYLKASSQITTMIIKLKLYSSQVFFNKELKHQSILQLFFGAMFILALYNFFVWLFSRDMSYLFYVLYVLGVIYHQLLYSGISYVYLFSQKSIIHVIEFSPLASIFPIMALALFCKLFLKTKQYPIFNKILNLLLIIVPINVLLYIIWDEWALYRNLSLMLLMAYLIILTIYAAFKKNRQAYFILVGWIIIFTAIMLLYLNSIGIFSIYDYFPYFIEVAFLSEALLFSIALVDKINQLQKERDSINNELITQQKTEKERLSLEVKKKTTQLEIAVQQQTDLLKELNHRVKNNMQTIISLVQLQVDEIDDENTIEAFMTIQNRIRAMSHLHELLYKQTDITHIPTYEYFDILVDGLLNSYEMNVNIYYEIKIDLQIEPAISCGLILNELITNSFKHAFNETIHDPKIHIELYKKEDTYYFNIYDNGIGYDPNTTQNSFGLILVSTLVEGHLEGTIETIIDNGVKYKIIWKDDV